MILRLVSGMPKGGRRRWGDPSPFTDTVLGASLLPKRPPDPQKPPKGESFDSLPLWTSPLNDQGRGPAGPLSLDPSQGFSNNKKPTPAAYFVTPPGFGWVVFYCSVSHPAGGCGQPPLQGQDHSTRRDGFNGGPAKAVLSLCGERRSKGADGVFAAGGNGRSGLCDDAVGATLCGRPAEYPCPFAIPIGEWVQR